MKYFSYIALLLLPAISSATIKFVSVSGVSATNIGAVSIVGSPYIYGGVAGPLPGAPTSTCALDNINTCNSCDSLTTLAICNRQRIYPNLNVTFQISSDKATGTPMVLFGSTVLGTGTSITKGATGSVSVTWANLCQNIANGTTKFTGCTDIATNLRTGTAEFKIIIDENANGTVEGNDDSATVVANIIDPDSGGFNDYNTITNHDDNAIQAVVKPGIDEFTAYPGDEKVYMEDLKGGGTFPQSELGTFKYINVYYSETGFITSPANITPKQLEITNNGTEVVNKVVDGLPNQANLYFRVSVSDPANNEVFFTDDVAINNLCTGASLPSPPGNLPLPPFHGSTGSCQMAATPDEVVGLLNKSLNCFIATAAYGSPFHPIVADLRKFRDRFLIPTKWGRAFVEKYYEVSPAAATWISEHGVMKKIVQVLLVPVWMGTLAAMWWPYTILFALGSLMIYRRYRRFKRG